MKLTSKHDLFDRQTCLAGLAVCILNMNSNLLYFSYFLTFKKELKNYWNEFNDPINKPVPDDFFDSINDPAVKVATQCLGTLSDFVDQLSLRYRLDLEACEYEYETEAQRYAPIERTIGKRNSYLRFRQLFEHYVGQISYTLYYYACAIGINSYNIPPILRSGIDFTTDNSFRLLNVDDLEVAALVELINHIEGHRTSFYKTKQ